MNQGESSRLLRDYIDGHNRGVRTGDFAALIELLHPNAQMRFRGIQVGPFIGRDAIARAFRTRPPDDELTVLRMRCEDSGLAVADYARKSNPAEIAGELRITIQSNRIIGIEVLVND